MELLQVGEVFEQVPSAGETGLACPQRVLWVSREENLIIAIGIEKSLKQPRTYELGTVMSLVNEGALRTIEVALRPYALLPENLILRRSLEIRDRAWSIIEPLVQDDLLPEIFLQATRSRMVQERAAELGLHVKQVYRPLYKYWAYGSCLDALLGCYDLCGPRGTQGPGTKKRGRRPDRVRLNGNDATLLGPSTVDVRRAIELGIADFLTPGVTVKRAWEQTKKKYFKIGEVAHGNLLVPIPPGVHQAPSLYQFSSVVRESNWDLSLTRRNMSTSTWSLKHRGVLGSSRRRVFGPAARYEIDATVVDVYLVSVFNRAWVIGRPVLYVVVDVFSRMVAGFYLGLEGPSWEGARHALFNAFSSKVDFCRQFGVEIEEGLWPCHHLPHKVLCDNGEMKSKASDALPKQLGITVQNAAVRRADWKPNVEQQFNLVNNHTVHFEPGALNPRLDEVQRRRCQLDACLTIPDLTRILIRRFIKCNLSAYKPDALPEQMLGENLTDATPLAVWTWGMENLTCGAKVVGHQRVWTKLLPSATASIRRDGIYFQGRLYSCGRAVREEWFARARTRGRVEHVEIRHVPYSPAFIWIFNQQSREWESCELLDRDEKFRLARFEEMLDRAKLLGLAAELKAQHIDQVCAKFESECDAITESARNAANNAKRGLSKTEKTANIDSNRAFEKAAERADHARDAALSYCVETGKDNNVVALRPDMRKNNPLDDLWDV